MAPLTAVGQDTPLPVSVDLGPEFQKLGLLPREQGRRDTCSLFAITALADFEYHRHNPEPAHRFSEEFLVWAANAGTGRQGDQAMFYEALHGLNSLGICSEESLSYVGGRNAAQTPSEKTISDAKSLSNRWRVEWLKRWDVRHPLTSSELSAIKRGLAEGHPVACGLRWPNKQRGPDLLEVPPAEGVFDGHSIVFTGYADDAALPGGGAFVFRNSSGSRWGRDGYGRISYAYATAYANDALILHCGKPDSETPTVRFEAESLGVLTSEKCQVMRRKLDEFGGLMWSQGEHLDGRSSHGGSVELGFDVAEAGRYRVRLLATTGPNCGQIQAALDGKQVTTLFDLYSGRVSPSGSLELGAHDLTTGPHTLRIVSTDKNPASGGYRFGLDTLDLIAID